MRGSARARSGRVQTLRAAWRWHEPDGPHRARRDAEHLRGPAGVQVEEQPQGYHLALPSGKPQHGRRHRVPADRAPGRPRPRKGLGDKVLRRIPVTDAHHHGAETVVLGRAVKPPRSPSVVLPRQFNAQKQRAAYMGAVSSSCYCSSAWACAITPGRDPVAKEQEPYVVDCAEDVAVDDRRVAGDSAVRPADDLRRTFGPRVALQMSAARACRVSRLSHHVG